LFKEELDLIKSNVDEQIAYVKEVKKDVREDMRHLESVVNDVETKLQKQKGNLATMIDNADTRFDQRRDALYSDTDRKIKDVEERLNTRLQRALDNPLAN